MTELLGTCWTHAGNAYPVPGHDASPWSIKERATALASAGFKGFGLEVVDVRAAMDTTGLKEARIILDDLGFERVELELLWDWWEEGDLRAVSDGRRRDLLKAAAELGAHHIKICGALPYESDVLPAVDYDRYVPALQQLAREATEAGTLLAFEFLPLTNVKTLRDCMQLLDAVNDPAVGVLIDIWHVERSETTLDEVREIPGDHIFAVEINDAMSEPVGSLFEDTIHRRVLPGEGQFDLAGFVDAIRSTGFDGPWGVEILSDVHRLRHMPDVVRDAYHYTKQALGEPKAVSAAREHR